MKLWMESGLELIDESKICITSLESCDPYMESRMKSWIGIDVE